MRNQLIRAFQSEFIKISYSRMLWITFIAFSLAPIMGAVFIVIVQNPDTMAGSKAFQAKAEILNFVPNWYSYLQIINQAMGVGGIMVFGFVASWVFGREYSDGTIKDLLSLPVSKSNIIHAKFSVYILWCIALAISNILVGLVLGTTILKQLPSSSEFIPMIGSYVITSALTIALGPPVAFFALYGKGYLAPLGAVALTLIFSQIIAAMGLGNYFPWAIPGLYSGAGGEYKSQLNLGSYLILFLTSIFFYLATLFHLKFSDQTK